MFYQWGRKDPLGRPGAWSGQSNVAVTVIAGTLPDNLTCSAGSTTFFTSVTDGINNRLEVMNEMANAGYAESKASTALTKNEVEKIIDGQSVMISADRHMIEKVTANPTLFVYATSYNANWYVLPNAYLWGNPKGYEYPRMSSTYKSIFDPCPVGYRMPPKDLWNNFLIDGMTLNNYYFNVKGGGTNSRSFNRGWTFYYKGIGTVNLDESGDPIGYTEPNDGQTEFYATLGNRYHTTGAYSAVGANGYYWSSSPANSSLSNVADFLSHGTTVAPESNTSTPRGFSVRCVKEN